MLHISAQPADAWALLRRKEMPKSNTRNENEMIMRKGETKRRSELCMLTSASRPAAPVDGMLWSVCSPS